MANYYRHTIYVTLFLGFLIIGCSGGGNIESSQPKILKWAAPSSYSDGSPLDPYTDLAIFEIYIKTNGSFTGTDNPTWAINAINADTGQLDNSFNLSSLKPYLADGVTYFVSVRTVAKNGMKSDFSQVAVFSF